VPSRWQKQHAVAAALNDDAWIRDIQGPLTVPVIMQYLQLRAMVHDVVLAPDMPDKVCWCWSVFGQYNSRSAYQAPLLGQTALLGAKELWRVKAPNKCLFMVWLALQDCCWTAERQQCHGLRDNLTCVLCCQELEAIDHLLVGCSFARSVWFIVLQRAGWQHLTPTGLEALGAW
jgi:hypothetical protein